MKAARLIVLGVALAAGGVAAMLASGNRQSAEAPPPAPPPPPALATVDVLIAKSDLDTGQVVGQYDVGWQVWPATAAGNFITKKERPDAVKDFIGAVVRIPVSAGEPIRDNRVVVAKGGYMAAILPRGRRAISLDIAPDSSAGGFVLPNDHVDVVLTRRDKAAERPGGGERVVSETILRNVRVLAIDQAVEEKDGQKVVVGKTATIELDPHQVETLAAARQLGTLSLALRSLLDSQSQVPEGGDGDDRPDRQNVNTVRYGVSQQGSR
jgi:pilus assembly protein CpaB